MLAPTDERVCLDARRHGVVLVRPFVHALALALVGGAAFLPGWPFSIAGLVFLAAAAASIVLAVWRWDRTHVVLTTEKLFVVHGLLRREAAAVRLGRIGAVEIEQSIAGRILGYGTIVAGELEIDYVSKPGRMSNAIGRLAG